MNIPLFIPISGGATPPNVVLKHLIDEYVATGNENTTGLINIDSGFMSLEVTMYARTEEAADTDGVNITLNSDSVAGNYDYRVGVFFPVSGTLSQGGSARQVFVAGGANLTDLWGWGTCTIDDPDSTDFRKVLKIIGLYPATTGWNDQNRTVCWDVTPVGIDTVELSTVSGSDFEIGSVIRVFGYK